MAYYFDAMEDNRKIFAAGSKKIAEIKGLTQDDIAAQIENGKQGTVSSWLRGRTKFPVERMPEFAKIFGMTTEEILEVGRKELQPEPEDIKTQIREVLAEENIAQAQPIDGNIIDYKDPHKVAHHEKINEFQNQEKALTMNSLAVYLEKLEPEEIEKAIKYLKERIVFQETIKGIKPPGAQKKTSNGRK